MDKHFDWTYDHDKYSDLPAIVKDLHDHGQHYMMIVVSTTLLLLVYPICVKEVNL